MKRLLILLILVSLIPSVSAATIYGNIYDLELNKLTKVMITIDTKPLQKFLSNDGSFSLQVNPGNYTLTAKQVSTELATEEKLTITDNGEYSYDLFLIPDQSLDADIINDLNYTENMNEDLPVFNTYTIWITISIIALILIITISLILLKKRKNIAEDDLSSKLIKTIKENGNRITQKELRQKFPYSEAKISLVITELEHKGRLEKIKRGRANVIILK